MQSRVWVRVKVCEQALRPEGKKAEVEGSMRKGEGSIVQQEGQASSSSWSGVGA